MLGTLNIHLSTNAFKSQIVTAILDSGSQSTLITTRCAKTLGINLQPVFIILHGISNKS